MPKNTKKLLILESPTKTKKVQEFLGSDFIVKSSNGHIDDLPINKMGIDVKNDFKMSSQILPDKIATVKQILEQAEKCDEVWAAGDLDREGERISASIKHYTDYLNKPFKRIVFEEITKSGIKKGIDNPKSINKNLVLAQSVRRTIDRLCGYEISPFISLVFGKQLSAGRVQSVCAKIISDREQEIEQFISQIYYNLFVQFITPNKETFIAKFESKISTKEQADEFVSAIHKEPSFIVQEVKSQAKKEYPNPPFTTSTCLQTLAKKYHIPGNEGQKGLQYLFELGLISYPRSDSTRISEEFLALTHQFLQSKNYDIPKKPIQYEPKDSSQNAHEALRPLSLEEIPELYGNNKLIYQEIYNQYLSSQLKPAIFDTLQVKIIGSKNNKLSFRIAGKSLKDPGYLIVFGKIDPGKIEIPLLTKNERLYINQKQTKTEQKETQPPPRYNDASFLKFLAEKNVGRPSTIGSMVALISSRGYVIKEKNTYQSTELGRKINDILSRYFSFMKIDFTSELETKLDLIANGDLNHLQVLRDFYYKFKSELDQAYQDNGFELCKCGGVMLSRKNERGEFLGCNKFCGNVKQLSREPSISKKAI